MTITLYKVRSHDIRNCASPISYLLEPLGTDADPYVYDDEGSAEYELPDGFELGETQYGKPCVYKLSHGEYWPYVPIAYGRGVALVEMPHDRDSTVVRLKRA